MIKDRVIRLTKAEKVVHNLNMVFWVALLLTGCTLYFGWIGKGQKNLFFNMHSVLGFVFIINLAIFVLFGSDSFKKFWKNLTTWDSDTKAWFRNLGGYPRKFGINFGPKELAPQGRFNGGQKLIYTFFVIMFIVLGITGIFIFFAMMNKGLIPREIMRPIKNIHAYSAFITTIVVILVHVPAAFLNKEDLKAMFRFGDGSISRKSAKEHSPKWLEEIEKAK
ncbi:MAG: cytochrome b/b6 domain-containing protein [Campylobacter sp.]|nr:cytochrome b/b6 domain-containing protein [Campylobacter sp.]